MSNYSDKNKEIMRKLSDLQIEKDKIDKLLEESKKVIDQQKGEIESKVSEIYSLHTK